MARNLYSVQLDQFVLPIWDHCFRAWLFDRHKPHTDHTGSKRDTGALSGIGARCSLEWNWSLFWGLEGPDLRTTGRPAKLISVHCRAFIRLSWRKFPMCSLGKGTEEQNFCQFSKPDNYRSQRRFGTGIINNKSYMSIEQIIPVHNTFPFVCWLPLHVQITSVFGSWKIIRLWMD